jgi:glutamate-1-semialdehyde 2,1-aminomutase
VQRCASIFWLTFSESAAALATMRATSSLPADAVKRYAPRFHALMERGIYLAPSAFEVGFLAATHSLEHLEHLATQLRAIA